MKALLNNPDNFEEIRTISLTNEVLDMIQRCRSMVKINIEYPQGMVEVRTHVSNILLEQ